MPVDLTSDRGAIRGVLFFWPNKGEAPKEEEKLPRVAVYQDLYTTANMAFKYRYQDAAISTCDYEVKNVHHFP